jgi:hypothetical protein
MSKSKPSYTLTERQKRFVAKAKREGFGDSIRYDYSGRFMYGAKCPAVYLDRGADFGFRGASQDQLGLGYVVYMPN